MAHKRHDALEVADHTLNEVVDLDRPARSSDEFILLRTGLDYILSVFVASAPDKGFPFLTRWAQQGDADIWRIVRANLGKARLKDRHRLQAERLLARLG